MEKIIDAKEKNISIDDIIAYMYLYVPILLFLITWIKPIFSYPVVVWFSLCGLIIIFHKRILVDIKFTYNCWILFLLLFAFFGGVYSQDKEHWSHKLATGQSITHYFRI